MRARKPVSTSGGRTSSPAPTGRLGGRQAGARSRGRPAAARARPGGGTVRAQRFPRRAAGRGMPSTRKAGPSAVGDRARQPARSAGPGRHGEAVAAVVRMRAFFFFFLYGASRCPVAVERRPARGRSADEVRRCEGSTTFDGHPEQPRAVTPPSRWALFRPAGEVSQAVAHHPGLGRAAAGAGEE